jgi:hypothetical protein
VKYLWQDRAEWRRQLQEGESGHRYKWRAYGKIDRKGKVFVIRIKVQEQSLWQDKEDW